jgi:hypothetical protein
LAATLFSLETMTEETAMTPEKSIAIKNLEAAFAGEPMAHIK